MSPNPDPAEDANGRPNIAAMAAAAALARSRQSESGDSTGGSQPMGPRPLMGGMNIAAAAAAAARKKSLQKGEGGSGAAPVGTGGRATPTPAGGGKATPSASPKASPPPKKNYKAFLKAVESNQLAESGGSNLNQPHLGSIEPLPFDQRADEARARGERADLMDVGGLKAPLTPNPYVHVPEGWLESPDMLVDSTEAGDGDGGDSGGDAGGGMTIAAMAAAAAQKKSSQKSTAGPPPTHPPGGLNIAALAAAAARKREKAAESPNPVRWTSGTIVKGKEEAGGIPAPPLGKPGGEGGAGVGAPVNIAAMAAAAAQKKNTAKETPSLGPPPGGIAAAAAAAARKKERSPGESPSAPSSGPSNPQSPLSGGLPPGGIAAAAAAAARKKNAAEESPAPGGIAAAAAAAARKKEQSSRVPPGRARGGIAALAAAAARKKEREERAAAGPPPGGIAAAAAAAAAWKKEAQSPPSGPPPGGIAAAAAAAARKKEAQSPLPPGGIAAVAAAPARQKERADPSSSERDAAHAPLSPPSGGPATVAGRELIDPAAAARTKERPGRPSSEASTPPPPPPPSGEPVWQTPSNVQTPGTPAAPPPPTPGSQQQQRMRARRLQLARQRSAHRRRMHTDFAATPNAAVDRWIEEKMDESSPPPAMIDRSYDAPPSASSNADDFMNVPIGTDADDFVGWKGTVAQRPPRGGPTPDRPGSRDPNGPDADLVHAKAAEALLRVLEAKDLRLDRVLARLERYQRRQGRQKTGLDTLYAPIDVDDYVAEEAKEDASVASELSTESANRTLLARNTVKLASHILHAPDEKFAPKSRGVPLKNDPEYGLYFRMLRYGFTIGAVRAALQRDGKPDITKLDPDRPIGQQAVPKVAAHDLDRELQRQHRPGTPVHHSSFERGQSIEIQGLEFGEEGLTDKGWESALESAKKATSYDRSESQGSSHRKASRFMSPLMPGSMTPSILRHRTRSQGSEGIPDNESERSALPPWLQGNAERGIVEGWLRKKTRRGRWVRRWYLLDSTGIYYAHAPPTAREARATAGTRASKFTKLVDARTLGAKLDGRNPHQFEVWHPSRNKAVATLRAGSADDAAQWVDAVSAASERLKLVDEVVVGQLVPENLVQNTVEIIQAREEAIRETYRTPEVEGRGGRWARGGGGGLGPIGEGEDLLGDFDEYAGDDYGGGYGYGPGGGFLEGDGLGGDGYGDGFGFGGGLGHGDGFGYGDPGLDDGEVPFDKFKRLLQEGTTFSTLNLSGDPKRSRGLKRQNSWPPLSLMSDGTLGAMGPGDGKTKEQLEADLRRVEDDLQRLKASGAREGAGEGQEGGAKEGETKEGEDAKDADGEPKLKDDPKYVKYFNMMKVGLPKDVAKHAMTRDQLDPSILDLDPEKSLKSQLAPAEGGGDGDPPLKDDPKYVKYFKMMKMGLPKEAAKHAMTRDQLDPSILDLDPEKSLKSQTQAEDADDGPPLKDDPKFAKYFKMLKMGLPKEAAKHAMTRDQLDPGILDLDPEKSLKSQTKSEAADEGPPLKDDPKFAKYFKMMKMGLPKEAAKHAMVRDQLDPAILDMDPEKSLKSQTEGGDEDDGPPLKDDPKYVKYFKMLKMGLPKEAAKHAMVRDQLDPKILDMDPEKSLKSQMDAGPPLKDDPKYAKYFKMLKMGLPIGAVKNALTRDGLDPAIMDLDHDKPVSSQMGKGKGKGPKKPEKPKVRRKKVFWNKVEAKEGTVWEAARELDIDLQLDVEEFENLFSQAIDADKEKEKKAAGVAAKSAQKTVKVIDAKRGMNGDIILRKIKMDPSAVASMIDNMDSDRLDAVELKSLYEFMPNEEEAKALTTYLEGQKSREEAIAEMTPCEQYMCEILDLKDSAKKFQSIIFLAEFKTKMSELKWDVDHLVAACDELRTSKRFLTLLACILILVNKINTGGEGGAEASGFSLDSLKKLSETKAFDNKTTVLHYLIRVVRKSNKDVLKFQEDIKSVVLAKGVIMERLLTNAKALCEDSRVVTETAAQDGEEYRASLKNKQDDKYKSRDVKAQRASVKELRQMVTFLPEKDVPIGKMDTTHFERFALFSKLELQKALSAIKEANQNYLGILEYFGEDMKTQATEFFGMIDQFMEAFDVAADLVEKEEEAKLKEARRALAKEAKLKVKSAFKSAAEADEVANALKGSDDEEGKPKKKSWRDKPVLEPPEPVNKKSEDSEDEDTDSDDDSDKEEEEESGGRVNFAAMAAASVKKKKRTEAVDSDSDSSSDSEEQKGGIAAFAAAAARKKEKRSKKKSESAAKQMPEPAEVEDVEDELMDFLSKKHPSKPPAEIAAMASAAARESSPPSEDAPKDPAKAVPDAESQNVEAELMSFLSKRHPSKPPAEIAAMAVAASRESSQPSQPASQGPRDLADPDDYVEAEIMEFLSKKHPSKPTTEIAAMAVAAARATEPPQAAPTGFDPDDYIEEDIVAFLSQKDPSRPPDEVAAMAAAAAKSAKQAAPPPSAMFDPDDYIEEEIAEFLSQKHPSKSPTEIAAMAAAAARKSTEPAPQAGPALVADPASENVEAELMDFLSKKHPSKPPTAIAAIAAAAARESSTQSEAGVVNERQSEPETSPKPAKKSGKSKILAAVAQASARRKAKLNKSQSTPASEEGDQSQPVVEEPKATPSGGRPKIIEAVAVAAAARKGKDPSQPAPGADAMFDPNDFIVEEEMADFLAQKHPSKPPAEIAAIAAAVARRRDESQQMQPAVPSAMFDPDDYIVEEEVADFLSHKHPSKPPAEIATMAAAVARRRGEDQAQPAPKAPTAMFDPDDYIEEEIADFLSEKHPSKPPAEIASMAAAVALRKEERSRPSDPESTQPPAVADPDDFVEDELMAFLSQRKTSKPSADIASNVAPAPSSQRKELEEEAQSALMARLRPSERSSLQSSGALSIAESAAAAGREKEEEDQPLIDESPQPRTFTQLRKVERPPSPTRAGSGSVDVEEDALAQQSEPLIDESTQPRTFTELRHVEREPSPTPESMDVDQDTLAVQPAIDESTQPRIFTELRHVERPALASSMGSGAAEAGESAVAEESWSAIDETPQPRIFTELRHVERPALASSIGSKSQNLPEDVEVEESGPAIDETTQPRIFTELRHVERPALPPSGGSRNLSGGVEEEEIEPTIDESSQPRIFTQLRTVERPKQPPSGAHMNIAAMAAAAARQRGEQNESSDEEEQLQNAFMARLRPVEKRAPSPEPEEPEIKPMYSLRQIRGETEDAEEDRTPVMTRPPPGLMNIAAAAAAAARRKEEQNEQQREEEARLSAERNAQRQQAKAEKRKKKAEAREVAEENARREQALAERRQKEEQAQLKAGITNIAAMAAMAAQRRSQAMEAHDHEAEERRRLAKEEAKKEAMRRAEQEKQEQYERERAAFERKQEAKRQRAEEQRRMLELETKELLKQQYHEDHVKREKLAAEKFEEAQRNAHLDVERRERAKRAREERDKLIREAEAQKAAARQQKEEARQRKAEMRRKKAEDREAWEQEMRERYEMEKKEIEEQARRELEQERLEREEALRDRKEQQRIAAEEKQKAQRAERLRRIKAEQQRVDMQVKRAAAHPKPSERQRNVAGTQGDAARRRREQAQRAQLMEQRKKEEARRLVAEAERLKKRLANEKTRASAKPRSSSQPRGARAAASDNVEDELMSWLSKKHPTKPGKAAPQKPASQSRLSAAVSQQAAKRAQPQSAAPKSRLSAAVAAKASSQRKAPQSAPPKASAKPVDEDTEMELLNWVKKSQARPAEI